ncbi:MAG TPA: HipA family kinase [Candidatus Acidoferrum sp.]|nr:HipA family kinase [Candidatus Acidoferrum sp.]
MLRAIEHIRRMRGGAQAHLMRCSDGNYYVVKFQNNPQHLRILVNELLGTRLASRLGLPTTPVAVVEVSRELIQLTQELCIDLARSRAPCSAGLQFGSRYPGDPRRLVLHDFLPDEKLREVANLHDFAGMLVFDKWTCNTNGRQTLFFEEKSPASAATPGCLPGESSRTAGSHPLAYRTLMIDQGFCFNAGEWNFPDAPLRGLYARNRVYEGVTGMESFGPWLERLEFRVTERVLAELAGEIPPEWYADDYDAVLRLLEQLQRRRTRVPELLLAAKKSNRQPFPYWVRDW